MTKKIFNETYDLLCKQIQRAERYIEWGLYDQAMIVLDYVNILQREIDAMLDN